MNIWSGDGEVIIEFMLTKPSNPKDLNLIIYALICCFFSDEHQCNPVLK